MPSSQGQVSGSLLLSVQKAFYVALSSNPALMALVTGVFDSVPDGQEFPYVVLDTGMEQAENTLDHPGRNMVAHLDVWSRGDEMGTQGFLEPLTVADVIIQILDQAILPMDKGVMTLCLFDELMTMRDTDGYTRHVRMAFNVMGKL